VTSFRSKECPGVASVTKSCVPSGIIIVNLPVACHASPHPIATLIHAKRPLFLHTRTLLAFTTSQIWVPEPSALEDLRSLAHSYLAGYAASLVAGGGAGGASVGGGLASPVDACVELYAALKAEAVSGGVVVVCCSCRTAVSH
jgi:hypothetical protein